MSELIDNSEKRKALLKHMLLQLHEGHAPEEIQKQLISLMQKIPYAEVVEVEQELINDGILSEKEILKFCDLHTRALEGQIDHTGKKTVPDGHPVDVFVKENRELLKVISQLESIVKNADALTKDEIPEIMLKLRGLFNLLTDVDKHYLRKENLLFPFLEKYGITGPPAVMWGKHDEIRELLKSAIEATESGELNLDELKATIDMAFKPSAEGVADMIMKEEEILFPMSLDKLTDQDWYDISRQTPEIGFCLYDPDVEWKPEGVTEIKKPVNEDAIQLQGGSLSIEELAGVFDYLPVDITFVDKNDKVRFFSHGKDRIFGRSRAILNRDVRNCHPPSSVHIVNQIINDFKSGKEESAPFWIEMKGNFIHIEYFAVRNQNGEYLGTLEVSQDLTEKRKLEGEQRILSYSGK